MSKKCMDDTVELLQSPLEESFLKKDSTWLEGPRERIEKLGPEALSTAELLSAILGSGSKEISVRELSQSVIEAMPQGLKSFDGIMLEDLTAIKGIGKSKGCQILACIELGRRIYSASQVRQSKLKCPADIASLLMAELRYKKQEIFKVVYLDTKHHVIGVDTITVGTLNASLVHPREVFKNAIRKSAYAMALVHNHPSGNPEPSPEDIKLTERLIASSEIIGIGIIDHVIIGDGVYYSLKEHGNM